MTWMVWRQHRNQAYFAAVALAAFATLLLITGTQIASEYHSALAGCAASHTCSTLASRLTLGSPLLSLLVNLTLIVPCLLGTFWGGPLVARELETGTSQFAWTQGVTRLRWLTVTTGWMLLAAAAWGGAISALVTWWSGPFNALNHQRFQPGNFDIQGIVPIGYSLFAIAFGIAAGTLLRRTLPALAVTVGGYIAVRIVIADFIRPHYLAARTLTYKLAFGSPMHGLTGSSWLISRSITGPGGQAPSNGLSGAVGVQIDGVPIGHLPAACKSLLSHDPAGVFSCLSAHGYRGVMTYQPASRYWAFQGIETGIFVVLAAALVAVAVLVLARRDA